nr:MAG TPA: hypothetical protein [Caudoviricetes sp.]
MWALKDESVWLELGIAVSSSVVDVLMLLHHI